MTKRATIVDVARLANVSITTVSRVINDNYPVSSKTKKKVNIAIEELGFRPNLLARSLIQDKTNTIGIITPSIENLFFAEVIKGIERSISKGDFRSFLCTTKGKPKLEVEMVDSLLNRSVDGIIVIDPRTENIQSGFYEGVTKRIPLVLINGYSEGIDGHFVLNDDEKGTLESLEHLAQGGKSNIGILRGSLSYSYDIKEKVYSAFVKKLGIDEIILNISEGNDLETVQLAKEALLQHFKATDKMHRVNGLLCCNDYMAVGAMMAIRELGLKIPEDISLIGFDNTILSQISEPAMTTVDHQMEKVGRTAADLMVDLIDGNVKHNEGHEFSKIMVETKLIKRQTT